MVMQRGVMRDDLTLSKDQVVTTKKTKSKRKSGFSESRAEMTSKPARREGVDGEVVLSADKPTALENGSFLVAE